MSASRTLVPTRTAPPTWSGSQIERPQLLARLDDALSRRLILLQVPAGYGKTSLLAQWCRSLEGNAASAAWLALEKEDADPARLAQVICAAIQRAGIDYSACAEEPGPQNAPQAMLTACVNALCRTERHVVLILDDFHRCASENVEALLRRLIRHAPRTFHLAIACRDRPNLGQAALAAQEDLLELGSEDLRFSPAEAEAVLKAGAATLHPDAARELLDRTEGWPIAVRIAALQLRGGEQHTTLMSGICGASNDLARYLSEQVLDELPGEVQALLDRTAIVERLTGELVNRLCGREDGWLVLERLERRNLFLVPLDAGRSGYRYQRAFAEILRNRLARRDPALLRGLHHTAAVWFAAQGSIVEAVRHAALAADESLMAQILNDAGGWRLIPHGSLDALLAGLGCLSEGTIARFPRLTLAKIYSLAKCGQLRAARERYEASIAAADLDALPPDIRTEVAVIGDILTQYENAPVSLDEVRAREARVRCLPPDDRLMLANAYESLHDIYWQYGWLEQALESALQARSHHRSLGSVYGELYTRFLEAQIKLTRGYLDEAEAILGAAAADIERAFGPRSDLAAQCAAYRAEIHYERGDMAAARALLDWALPRLENSEGWLDLYATGFLTAARPPIGKSLDESREVLARTRKLAARQQLRPLAWLADLREIELLLDAGMDETARAMAGKLDLRELGADLYKETSSYRRVAVAAALCSIRIDLLSANPRRALAELTRMDVWAREHGFGRLLIRIGILAAQAHRLLHEPDPAALRFDEAVGRAMFQGFVYPFVEEWRFIELPADAGARAARSPTSDRFRERFLSRVRRALERHAAERRESALLNPAEAVTLQHLNRGYSNKEIARLLKVSPETVKCRLKNLYEKLAVNSRKDAVRVSRERGLVDGS